MKFIHLADLHIGKRVNGFSMMEDQRYILDRILEIARREQADGLLLAGDLYDKQVPPAEAVSLLDSFLTAAAEENMAVFAVAGNHDSAERMAFGAQLMSSRGVYLSPVYEGKTACITLKDEWGELCVHLLPFIRPAAARHVFLEEKIESHQDAVSAVVRHMEIDPAKRNVLVAHQFVTGASRCESEEVSVGGLDNVDAAVFDAFDYVALGHIHSPQHIRRETVRYSGTPLKYSFSEAEQEKSVAVVELAEKGKVSVRKVLLVPIRDMRKIRGTYLEVTEKSFYEGTNTEDYLQITLTDEQDVPDGLQKLRIIYPNLMRLEYDNSRTRENRMVSGWQEEKEKSELELFSEFYELQNNRPMSARQEEFVKQLIGRLKEKGTV